MSERQVVSLNNLDREAQLYKQAKNDIVTNTKILQEAIDKNTKEEVEAVQVAIKNLNSKVEKIMEHDFVKEKNQIIERSEKQMIQSIKSAADTFFKVRKVIHEKDELSHEHKIKYEQKLLDKILDKFMTKEEKDIFNKIVNGGQLFIGGDNPKHNSSQMLGF
jgi:hypothetical protein